MNGNNEQKEVKQTPNEQPEKLKKLIERGINQIENDPEFLIHALGTVKERDEKINQSLGDLSKQIACDHAGLKGENAAFREQIDNLNGRLQKIEQFINDIDKFLRELELPAETADQPADEKPEQTDKKEQPDGSGL